LVGKMHNARILIVDDDESYWDSLKDTMPDCLTIVTDRDPIQALKTFEYQGPFVVIITTFRLVINGLDLLTKVQLMDKHTQRILLVGQADLSVAIDALNRGRINAFLIKPILPMTLRSVVHEAIWDYQERRSNSIRSNHVRLTGTNRVVANRVAKLYAPLTAKEKEVLYLLAKGCSNAEISEELHITVGTVKTHLNNLFCKMAVASRAKVVAKGIELGLLTIAALTDPPGTTTNSHLSRRLNE